VPDCTRKIHADTAIPKKAEAKLQALIQQSLLSIAVRVILNLRVKLVFERNVSA
jgi:hypothetical protein